MIKHSKLIVFLCLFSCHKNMYFWQNFITNSRAMFSIKNFLLLSLIFSYNFVLAQCPTVVPTGSDACKLQAGSVELGASGSTGHFSWYDASSGGSFLGSGSIYNTPDISSTTTYYVAAAEDNYALDFDGTDDVIALGNPAQLQITGDMTIEMWVYPTDFSERRNPYAKAYGGEGTITQEKSGVLSYYYGTNGGNGGSYQAFSSSAHVALNEWNHIAIVRDLANMKLYWYINGNLTSQRDADYAAATSGTNIAYIGNGYTSSYMGNIDEVRIWNTTRTQAQIQANKDICMQGTETGLVAYYKFNDGPNEGTLTDLTSNGLDGTLTNMDVANDWVISDNDYYCSSCESSRTAVVATIDNGAGADIGADVTLGCQTTSVTIDAGVHSSYLWSTGATTQTISTSTKGKYWVEVDNGAGCSDKDTMKVDEAGGSDNCLTFDGDDDNVNLGNSSELRITGNMTIEMWLYPTDFSVRRNPYAKAYGGEGTITQETSGTLSYYYGTSGGNGGSYQSFSSGGLTINQWNHIAIVRDLTNMKLYWYINGVLSRQGNANYASATSGGNDALIGKGYVDNFEGQIEEFRMWKVARTQTQIRDNICKKLHGLENGLVAYYRFDEGSGSTLHDLSNNSIDGTISNGPVWTTSSAPIGDESSYLYTNSWSGKSLTHSTCSGENLTVDNMSGSPTGVHIYSVNAAPTVTAGISGLGINNRYFGVFKVNDVDATYKATYDYANNPHVISDANLQLYKRDNNADNTWVDANAVLDISNDKLEATAQGTQFVLGTSSSQLPIELLDLSANIDNSIVNILWTTASEINNDYFTIQRSQKLDEWNDIIRTEGAGNSNDIIQYSEVDMGPFQGISYYRLKQTDFDGTFTYSNIVSINNIGEESKNEGYLLLYPNPVNSNNSFYIEFIDISDKEYNIELRDILGRVYYSKFIHNADIEKRYKVQLNNNIPKGVYFIVARSDQNTILYKKLVINN